RGRAAPPRVRDQSAGRRRTRRVQRRRSDLGAPGERAGRQTFRSTLRRESGRRHENVRTPPEKRRAAGRTVMASAIMTPQLNVLGVGILILSIAAGFVGMLLTSNPIWVIGFTIVGVILMQAPRVANQWERAVVLRLGRYVGLRGPGLFWIVPLIDRVTMYIDQRVITTSFAAEQTLTSDTVPVNVDAVLFSLVYDAEKSALEVQEYTDAVSWASQTALRDIIGRTYLTDLLRGRERIEEE